MPRARGKLQDCTAEDARTRLQQARLYLTVAETVLGTERGEEPTVATGNAVLAAVAAADAICCAITGSRFRGQDHAGAADHLAQVTGDSALGALLRDVVAVKDLGHYGLGNLTSSRAKTAIRKARRLVDEADRRVR